MTIEERVWALIEDIATIESYDEMPPAFVARAEALLLDREADRSSKETT